MKIHSCFRGPLLAGLMAGAVAGWGAQDGPDEVTTTNGLGMRFRSVPGTSVLFSVWPTRVRDFEAFVAATGYDATAGVYSIDPTGWVQTGANWRAPGFLQTDEHPACGLSWLDAQAFCTWLTNRERSAGRIAATQSYRLPTDREWNAAAGVTAETGQAFPWGQDWPPAAAAGNYAGSEARDATWPGGWATIPNYDDGYPRTSPVGRFAANKLGLHDMSGNVWQWCEDLYSASGNNRVVRGASFRVDVPDILKLGRRGDGAPESRYVHRGFRCVLTRPVSG